MKHRVAALLLAAGTLAACTAEEVDVDAAAVTRANGALPVRLQADLRGCEADAMVRHPVREYPVGANDRAYAWACTGDRCQHVYTTPPVGTRGRNVAAFRSYVRSCMAAKGYKRLGLPQCAPEEVPGADYRLSSAPEGACAARVKGDGWIAVVR